MGEQPLPPNRIDLVGGSQTSAGVTLNDAGDGDSGPNQLLNYPVLTSAVNGSVTTISGTLNSVASSTFTVELYSSPSADPSTFGEGATFLGSVTITTNASGNGSFSFPAATLVPAGQAVTATSTDATGDTSEFSKRVLVS